MKEYLFVLLGAVIISGIVGMISPDGDIKKYISLILCFCVLTATVKPISQMLEGIAGAELEFSDLQMTEADYENIYEEYLICANEDEFSERLKQKMSQELKIPKEQVGVKADMTRTDNEYGLRGITVELYGMGIMQDPEKIKSYIRELFGVECVIVYG